MSSAGAQNMNAANLSSALQAQQFNAHEAELNRNWQMYMSNTQYQRAMADMKAAGLNPILAYQQGGAGVPGGAQASGVSTRFENEMEGLGQGVTSAAKGAAHAYELAKISADTATSNSQAQLNVANADLAKASTGKAVQDTATSAAQARKADAETGYTIEQMDNPAAMRALMGAQGHSAYQQGEVNRRIFETTQKYGPSHAGGVADTVERVLNRFSGAFNRPPSGYAPGTPLIDRVQGFNAPARSGGDSNVPGEFGTTRKRRY